MKAVLIRCSRRSGNDCEVADNLQLNDATAEAAEHRDVMIAKRSAERTSSRSGPPRAAGGPAPAARRGALHLACAPRLANATQSKHLESTSGHKGMSQFVRIPPKDVGMRLDRWLRARLPNTPQSMIAKLIRKRAIRIATKATAPPSTNPSVVAWQHTTTEISTRLDANAFVMMPAELASTAVSHTPPSSASASARNAIHSPPAAVDFGVGLHSSHAHARSQSQSQQQQRQSNAELSADAQARLRSWVLFADEHVIAINKPPKLPVQGGPGVHRALTDWYELVVHVSNASELSCAILCIGRAVCILCTLCS